MSKIISIYNHKGGTGKTTSTINIGIALNNLGYSVLLVDLDPQANMTYSLGVELDNCDVNDILSSENVVKTDEGVDLLPNITSPQFLSGYEFPHETYLKEKLEHFFEDYDYVLLDCPPSIGITIVNAIMASDGIVIPIIPDALSLEGLRQVISAIENLLKQYNKELEFLSVLPVMVDSRRKLSKEIIEYIKSNFDVTLFENHIRMNVKVAEAPSYGKSVITYNIKSIGALDYIDAANELINN